MPRTGEREVSQQYTVITLTPADTLLPVYKVLVQEAVDNLAEWCIGEEPQNLKTAIKMLRVLELYSADVEP